MKKLKSLFAASAAVVLSLGAFAAPITKATPKAVLSNGGATLTFVYDNKDYGTKDTDWFSVNEAIAQAEAASKPWKAAGENVTRVVFADSFASCKPTNCLKWFVGFAKLVSVTGIENLDVSEATSLKMMFGYCSSLRVIDMSQFDTAKVTTMLDMFTGCSNLQTIYASDRFVTTALAKPTELVFSNCSTKLVGGEGTTWSSSYRTAARAKVDGGVGNEGYFTEKTAKVVWNATEKSLTFVFDAKNHGTKLASGATGSGWFSVAEAEALDPNDSSYDVPWCNVKASATTVAVDPTFAMYRPKHCAEWFLNCKNAALTSITGLHYLNVSRATNLDAMFANCNNLRELDLTNFNTKNVTSMWHMFMASSMAYTQLKTIYATDKFVTDKLTTANADLDMFANLKYLTGGNGTTYKSGTVGKAYAHIDAAGAPGYFTVAPVAVLDDAVRTLTFYADGADHSGVDKTVYSVLAAEEQDADDCTPPWFYEGSFVTNVVIDASFKAHQPKHCASWFSGYDALVAVEGLENLDVSEATSLFNMFYNCCELTELDLSSFDTRKVTSIASMFGDCSKLKTIYASDRFVTTGLSTPSETVFGGCSTKLIGGEGTTWNSSMCGAEYAKIDGGMDDEGYFTRAELPVAVYVSGESALKFYYDSKDHTSEGTVFYVDEAVALGAAAKNVPWHDELNLNLISTVVFDSSFAGYQPTSCARWFYDFSELTSVTGLQYLDVSKATAFNLMFFNCSKVETLDLSTFKTPCLTAMFGMFNNCSALTTIYATDGFSIENVTATAGNAFQNCDNLVGGRGSTVASLGAATVAYARIDREGNPGLFTLKGSDSIAGDDLDGNGLADIVMTIDSDTHPHDGATGAWLIQSSQTAAWGDLSTRNDGWKILGTGITSAGKTTKDVYIVSADNVVGAWVTGSDGKVTGWETIGSFDAQTTVGGLGDFNGDGQSDLLLVNDNGAIGCYFTSGSKTGWNYFQSLGEEWDICGIGDLNGDGRDDLVLLHDAGFAGSWLTQADGTMAWADLDTLPAGFEIAGCGDFNGDGTDDVLLKKGDYYGAWIVQNGNASAWMGLGDLGSVTVEQIADFDGDGADDLRIRTAAGDLGAECVKGEDNLEWHYYGSVGDEWNTEPSGLK